MSTFLIETNQLCNFSCKYCFYNEFGRSNAFLTVSQLENVLKNIKKAKFYITGGEPFINPEIEAIIKYLSTKGSVSIFTNASLLNNQLTEKILPFIDMFFVSLDGFDFENDQRGHTVEILKKIDMLMTIAGEKVTIKTCLYGQPFGKYKEFVETLNSMGIKHFSINVIGKNYQSTSNKQQLKEILEWIFSRKEIFQPEYVKVLYDYYIRGKIPSFETCLAGDDFFYIYANGKMVGCPDNKENFVSEHKRKCIHSGCIPFWEFFTE